MWRNQDGNIVKLGDGKYKIEIKTQEHRMALSNTHLIKYAEGEKEIWAEISTVHILKHIHLYKYCTIKILPHTSRCRY